MRPSAATYYTQRGTVSFMLTCWPTHQALLLALRSPKSSVQGYLTCAQLDVEATPQTLALVQATTL